MIDIRNVTFQYSCSHRVLEGISWSMGTGMYGLLGPNGAGKTTLLRLLATLAKPTKGEVRIGGISVSRPEEVRGLIGYLPQMFELPQRMSVTAFLEYMAVMRGIHDTKARKLEKERLLHELNLSKLADKQIDSLSSGMKQRVGLAQAMMGSPPVLIVDEPTVGLDPEERLRLRNLMSRYSASGGRTVLLSTHLLPDVEMSCSSLAVLKGGRIIMRGTPQEIADIARGQVWSMELSEREFAVLSPTRLIRACRTHEGIRCRLLSQMSPGDGAILMEPLLEDGYLALIGEGGL